MTKVSEKKMSDTNSVDDSLPSFISQNIILQNNQKNKIKNKNNSSSSSLNGKRIITSSPSSPSSTSPRSPKSTPNPINLSLDILLDKSLNYSQKERISEAILKGTLPIELQIQNQGNFIQTKKQQQQQQSKHEIDIKSHNSAHLNRHLYHQTKKIFNTYKR